MAGRPTDYLDEYAEQATKLAAMGATDAEVADFFAVDVRTIYRWKHAHEAFCQALRVGKDIADDRVVRSLYQRAIGYEQEEVKIFMPAGADEPVYAPYIAKIAPSDTAAIFWVKNRRPDEWRDRHEVDNTSSDGSMTPASNDAALAKITEKLDEIAKRAGTDSDATGE